MLAGGFVAGESVWLWFGSEWRYGLIINSIFLSEMNIW